MKYKEPKWMWAVWTALVLKIFVLFATQKNEVQNAQKVHFIAQKWKKKDRNMYFCQWCTYMKEQNDAKVILGGVHLWRQQFRGGGGQKLPTLLCNNCQHGEVGVKKLGEFAYVLNGRPLSINTTNHRPSMDPNIVCMYSSKLNLRCPTHIVNFFSVRLYGMVKKLRYCFQYAL